MGFNIEHADSLRKHHEYDHLFEYCKKYENDPNAMAELSTCYFYGYGTKANNYMCFYYDLKAAHLGSSTGKANLAYDYLHGIGTGTNYKTGLELLKQSIEDGCPKAVRFLGRCYELGLGVEKNEAKAVELYQKAADMGDNVAVRILGRCYEFGIGVEKDETKAVELYKKAANAGNEVAVRFLGRCYEFGTGVEKDETKAVELYQKAAAFGDKVAVRFLGQCYEFGTGVEKDETKAVELYQKAADMGDNVAVRFLGVCYKYGNGVEKDEAKAVELYQKAADMGDDVAIRFLAQCYWFGIGVEKNQSKAVELYTKAANMGNDDALVDLGICYAQGIGIEKDESKAAELYKKAADLGNTGAVRLQGACYQDGCGVKRDEAKAVELYTKAANMGDDNALVDLGICYAQGTGIKKDEAKAVELYVKAADMGNSYALLCLGLCYAQGTGVRKDESKAAELYEKAADMGNVDALVYLGSCYTNGIGVKKNLSKAVELYDKASQKRNSRATYFLAKCYMYNVGVKKDSSMAFKLFKLSVEQFDCRSQNGFNAHAAVYLGFCYLDSENTQQNLELALNYFHLAMENSDVLRASATAFWCLTILSYLSYFESQKYDALELLKVTAEEEDCFNWLNKIYRNNATEKTARKLLRLYQAALAPRYSKISAYRLWINWEEFKLNISSKISERHHLRKDSFSLDDIRLLKEELNKVSTAMDMKDTLLAEKEQIIKTLMQEAVYQKETLRSEQQKTQDILKKISDKIVTVEEGVGIIYAKTDQIQTQMNQLIYFAENDLQKWLQKEKEDIAPFIQNNNEKAIAAFADKLANYLSIHIHGSDTLIQKETANLQSIFGIIWDRLLPTTQTSLVSAGVLWSYCEDIGNNFDYSGVCISATSALESELKRVFYTGFQEYLYNHYGDPSKLPMDTVFSVWPEKLLNKTKAACQNEFLNPGSSVLGIGNSFTLGTLPYLFWDKDPVNRKLLQQRMKEYLQTIVKDCYADNPLKYINPLIKEGDKTIRDPNSFISQCEQIRENFRNPAAHIDIIPWEKADECYSEVVGKADSFRYATQAKGLIMKLYEFLK